MELPQPTGSTPKKTILVIDDDEMLRKLYCSLLSKTYDLKIASDGQTGLDLARKARPDLLLTDWDMPGITGIDLVRKLREQYKGLVCIIASGDLNEGRIKEAKAAGVADTLGKPFTPKALYALIARCIGSETAAPPAMTATRLLYWQ